MRRVHLLFSFDFKQNKIGMGAKAVAVQKVDPSSCPAADCYKTSLKGIHFQTETASSPFKAASIIWLCRLSVAQSAVAVGAEILPILTQSILKTKKS
jgi:hypothetical protein